jgi:hypothetical protein
MGRHHLCHQIAADKFGALGLGDLTDLRLADLGQRIEPLAFGLPGRGGRHGRINARQRRADSGRRRFRPPNASARMLPAAAPIGPPNALPRIGAPSPITLLAMSLQSTAISASQIGFEGARPGAKVVDLVLDSDHGLAQPRPDEDRQRKSGRAGKQYEQQCSHRFAPVMDCFCLVRNH